MEIRIKVEKGAVPDEELFTKISDLIKKHAWHLDTDERIVVDNIQLERSYSSLEITQLRGEEDDES